MSQETAGGVESIGIVLETSDPERAWNAFRFGITALEAGTDVSVFLLGEGVEAEEVGGGEFDVRDRMEAFADAGGDAETRLAFTGEAEQTIQRVTVEEDCAAIVHPGVAHNFERLLVPFVGQANVETVAGFVAELVGDRDITVSALGLDANVSREELRGALDDAGLTTADLTLQPESTGDALATIAEFSVDYDVVVMGEPKPTLSEWVFGELEDRVARESLGPVVVVRARE